MDHSPGCCGAAHHVSHGGAAGFDARNPRRIRDRNAALPPPHGASVAVEEQVYPLVTPDQADFAPGEERSPYNAALATRPDVAVYRLSGAFFFGAAAAIAAVMDRLAEHPKIYVIDLSAAALLDSTAATTLAGFVRKARRRGASVYAVGASPETRRVLLTHGLRPPELHYRPTIASALDAARPGGEIEAIEGLPKLAP